MTALPEAFLRVPLAHRALHDSGQRRPENSRAAIAAAVQHGYGIEIDLQLSRDNVAMVFHDYRLDRLTARQGHINEYDAGTLSDIHLDGSPAGIPRLADALEQIEGRVPLLIELKDQHGQMGPSDGRLERATALALQGYRGPVAVMSFNPHMVEHLSQLLPDVPRGLVTCAYRAEHWPELTTETRTALRDIPDYDRVGASFISHRLSDLARPRVAELKDKGAAVLCWTVRSPEEEAEARRIAANITFEGYLAPLSA
ncbi:MAG: glycerophosphodiester phosphodiesterase family protein [Pseudomonadota bacterium]